MGIVIAIAGGMILWVVLWGLGAKGFDAGMLFLLIVLAAATVRGVTRILPGNQDPEESRPDAAPFN